MFPKIFKIQLELQAAILLTFILNPWSSDLDCEKTKTNLVNEWITPVLITATARHWKLLYLGGCVCLALILLMRYF